MSVEFPTLNKCNTIQYRASSGCKSYAPGNDAERTWSMDHGPWNKVAATCFIKRAAARCADSSSTSAPANPCLGRIFQIMALKASFWLCVAPLGRRLTRQVALGMMLW